MASLAGGESLAISHIRGGVARFHGGRCRRFPSGVSELARKPAPIGSSHGSFGPDGRSMSAGRGGRRQSGQFFRSVCDLGQRFPGRLRAIAMHGLPRTTSRRRRHPPALPMRRLRAGDDACGAAASIGGASRAAELSMRGLRQCRARRARAFRLTAIRTRVNGAALTFGDTRHPLSEARAPPRAHRSPHRSAQAREAARRGAAAYRAAPAEARGRRE